jgi:hypothetical protein
MTVQQARRKKKKGKGGSKRNSLEIAHSDRGKTAEENGSARK